MAVVAIQGFDTKQNKSVYTAACLAGMISMQSTQKTLILQFINSTDRGAELFLNGVRHDDDGLLTSSTGMDTLLEASVNGNEISSDDFSEKCDNILKAKNKLDVAGVTKTTSFLLQLIERKEEISNLFDNANDIYDNVIEVLPTLSDDNRDIVEYLNGFADVSIYCRRQGNHKKIKDIFGKKIVYLFSDFDSSSKFGLRDAKKEITTDRHEQVLKIESCRGALDAAQEGRLIYFIRDNKDADGNDVNTIWVRDLKEVIDVVFEGRIPDKEPEWARTTYVAGKEYEEMKKGVPEANKETKKSGGLFGGLFGKKKAKEEEAPVTQPVSDKDGSSDTSDSSKNPIDDGFVMQLSSIGGSSSVKDLSLDENGDDDSGPENPAPVTSGETIFKDLGALDDQTAAEEPEEIETLVLPEMKPVSEEAEMPADTSDNAAPEAEKMAAEPVPSPAEAAITVPEFTHEPESAQVMPPDPDIITNDRIEQIKCDIAGIENSLELARADETDAKIRFDNAQKELSASADALRQAEDAIKHEEYNLSRKEAELVAETEAEKERRRKAEAKRKMMELNADVSIRESSAEEKQKDTKSKILDYAASLKEYAQAKMQAASFLNDNKDLTDDSVQQSGKLSPAEALNIAEQLLSIAEKVENPDYNPAESIKNVVNGAQASAQASPKAEETESTVPAPAEASSEVADSDSAEPDDTEDGTEDSVDEKPFLMPESGNIYRGMDKAE